MDKIRNQHKHFVYSVFVLSASLYFFLYINTPSTKSTLNLLRWFGFSWPACAAFIIFVYERWGWKIVNPRFDFSGQWDFFENQFSLNPETGEHNFEYEATGSMKIMQSVRSIAIIEGQTHKKNLKGSIKTGVATWWSLSCELDKLGSILHCALDHKSAPGRKGGAVKYGVEVLTVEDRDNHGRPIKMSSVVYHCVGTGTPHLVNATYNRKQK